MIQQGKMHPGQEEQMSKEQVESLTVGSLVSYSVQRNRETEDMGILSEILILNGVRYYRFIWKSNLKKTTTETKTSLQYPDFSLVQLADPS
jgi:hypothetical protein